MAPALWRGARAAHGAWACRNQIMDEPTCIDSCETNTHCRPTHLVVHLPRRVVSAIQTCRPCLLLQFLTAPHLSTEMPINCRMNPKVRVHTLKPRQLYSFSHSLQIYFQNCHIIMTYNNYSEKDNAEVIQLINAFPPTIK